MNSVCSGRVLRAAQFCTTVSPNSLLSGKTALEKITQQLTCCNFPPKEGEKQQQCETVERN